MTFPEACKKLNIEDYQQRIFDSNSHGELFHIWSYVALAETLDQLNMTDDFRTLFVGLVSDAEKTWKRPESVFQHIPNICLDGLRKVLDDRQ